MRNPILPLPRLIARSFLLFGFLTFIVFPALTQDFMLQAWYWEYPVVVDGKRLAQRLELNAPKMHEDGFSMVWLPPLSRGSAGSTSMGYDVRDLFDMGEYTSSVRAGSRVMIDDMVAAFQANGIVPVGDLVLNHRDGGLPEVNPAVEGWIENFSAVKVNQGDSPFPTDRYQCFLPVGGATANGPGTYYFKIRSASQHPDFYGKSYRLHIWSNKTGFNPGPDLLESEPNGGGDCGEGSDTIQINRQMVATLDIAGCGTDEFALVLDTADFNASADTLWITMRNQPLGLGNFSDHYIYGIWSGPAAMDVQPLLKYQTYTDFTSLPSGRGDMDWTNFRPNGNPTSLSGFWDGLWFFNDYDQTVPATRDSLIAFAKWMHENAGITGMRLDAVKHFPPQFLGDLLDALHDEGISPPLVVGEYFDYDLSALSNWVADVEGFMDPDTKADVLVRVFDFGLRKALKDACDQAFFDVRNVYNQSIRDATGRSGFSVVTFIDNHDLNHMGGSIISDPDLAYAYILTNNQIGLPCVFEKDMYGTPSAPNSHVGDEIRALIEAHRRYIFGATEVEYLNRLFSSFTATYTAGLPEDCLIYQLSNSNSGREVVVCINFGQSLLKVEHSLSLANLSIGDTLTDIFGSSAFPISTVSPSGQVYMEVPARSFALWVEGDLRDEIIPIGGGATPLNDPLSDEFMDLQIFPNPVSGPAMITFSMPSHEKVYFSLFDMKGSLAWRTTVEAVPGENRLPFDLPGNREGLFFLKMEGKNFSKYLKVVKK